ncbi:MAG: serine hydroxymethyltransferase [Bdellovibrionota bacterium]|nr:serine hydroxymethyltransferase [Pseudomonadota bacterium]MDY6090516.1 serine hydroxymethyltransferase [Bdellovibrionota bacterium]
MTSRHTSLKEIDPEIFDIIKAETRRQEEGLELIPSENFVDDAILEACGSILTNKYAEGLPGKRYYGGCEEVDKIEGIAIERAKKLFNAEFANVQPHSGAQANHEVFNAFLEPGDTYMGMKLDHGGHLSHGLKANLSGRYYNVVPYGVDKDTGLIDYDEVERLALECKPKMIICGASAYSRVIDFKRFREIADKVGAILFADVAHYAGLIVGGAYPSPFPYCDVVTTTTHKTLRGPRSGLILAKKEYESVLNKSVFPGVQGGPHMHTIAAKAIAFKEAMSDEFKAYANQVVANARALAKTLMEDGYKIVSGGTDSHVLIIDLRSKGITGKEAQEWLDKVNITANKNTIPYDPQPPTICSGLRIGTPALTTRGMKEVQMKKVAQLINRALVEAKEGRDISMIKEEVKYFAKLFPLYDYKLD